MLRYQTGVDFRGRREGGNWHAGYFDLLAKACEVAGDLTKARETYAKSCYHLGLIAEQQGDKTRAREQFRKFLDLWKAADPGPREAADAKRRMAQ
jgi:predicted Zn-dependent protease